VQKKKQTDFFYGKIFLITEKVFGWKINTQGRFSFKRKKFKLKKKSLKNILGRKKEKKFPIHLNKKISPQFLEIS